MKVRSAVLPVLMFLAVGAVVLAGFFAFTGDEPAPPEGPAPERANTEPEPTALPAGRVRIAGVLVSEEGSPLEGGYAYLLEPGDPILPTEAPRLVRSDESGRFLLEMAEGVELDLIAYRSGFRPARIEAVTGGHELRVVLPAGGKIAGSVVDDLGRPLVGARVTARTAGTEISPPRGVYLPNHETLELTYARTLSMLGGAFDLSGIGDGPVEITVVKRGYPEMQPPGREFSGGERGVSLVLLRPFKVEVLVRDGGSGKAIPAASIKIEPVDEGIRGVEGVTDLDGRFLARMAFPAAKAPDVSVKITAYSEKHGETVADGVPLDRVEEGKGFGIQVTTQAPARLRLKLVYDTGEPFKNWVYFAVKPSAGPVRRLWSRAAEDGWFTIRPRPGHYEYVRPVSEAELRGKFLENVSLRSGQDVSEVLTVIRGGDLSINAEVGKERALNRGRIRVEVGEATFDRRTWGAHTMFRDLPPGEAKVTINYQGFAEKVIELPIEKGAHEKHTVKLDAKKRENR